MAILELIDVSKSFGEKKVLNHLSLTVKEKTIFGFIGKNGAGKTTTMKLFSPEISAIRTSLLSGIPSIWIRRITW